ILIQQTRHSPIPPMRFLQRRMLRWFWWPLRGLRSHGQRAHQAALRQFDLESVFAARPGALERLFRSMAEQSRLRSLAFEYPLGFERTPRLGPNAAHR